MTDMKMHDPLSAFRKQTEEALRRALEETRISDATIVLEKPPEGMGDLGFPCFQLAKLLKKPPTDIAKDIASKVAPGGMIGSVDAEGGYVNFHVGFEELTKTTIAAALSAKECFGSGPPNGIRVLLEHTSVNPTGPIHIGRARNPIIGDTLARIMRLAGYEVVTEFYVNDVGRQVATMTWGVKNLSLDDKSEREKGDHRLVPYYREAHSRCDDDRKALEEVDALLLKLEH
ncbi:MAG: arginine--tRNA ligase, partial [Methanobacteriota archaeon]